MSGKYMIDVPNEIVSSCETVKPAVIIFPTPSDEGRESFEQISSKYAWLKLIQLSISKQFSSAEKEVYMKRLKELCKNTIIYQYSRTSQYDNMLKEICTDVKQVIQNITCK